MPNTNSIQAGGGLDWILAVKTDAERERKETLEGKKNLERKRRRRIAIWIREKGREGKDRCKYGGDKGRER